MISRCGGIAQLGERLHGMQEVSGSIPLISTKSLFILNNAVKSKQLTLQHDDSWFSCFRSVILGRSKVRTSSY
jgi:hypothetical protein